MKRIFIIGIILAMMASLFISAGSVLASNAQFNQLDCGYSTIPYTGSGLGGIAGAIYARWTGSLCDLY